MNRQRQLLLIVLLLLVAAVVSAYMRWPRQKSVDTLKYAPGQKATMVAAVPATTIPVAGDGRVLRLDLLDGEQTPFEGYRRNLFKSFLVEDIKASRQKSEAVRSAQPPPVNIPRPPVISEAPKRELTQFAFMGFFEVDNRKTVFLSRGKEMLLVREGRVFAGKYKAVSITDQALTIQVMDTNDQIVIPLVENRISKMIF